MSRGTKLELSEIETTAILGCVGVCMGEDDFADTILKELYAKLVQARPAGSGSSSITFWATGSESDHEEVIEDSGETR